MKTILRGVLMSFLILLSWSASSQKINFSDASIFIPDRKNKITFQAIQVLQEEIQLRSGLKLPITYTQLKNQKILIVCQENELQKLKIKLSDSFQQLSPTGSEGFKICWLDSSRILIAGYDERGVLYGIGRLLRKMDMTRNSLLIPEKINVSSTPRYPIRGHQLGYRPKTNAYDAWTVADYDRYIRDLALFGSNSIEIMPPRTDDDLTSVNMKLPALQMNIEQSRICQKYGLDVWMWYPNLGSDFSTPEAINKELKEREEVFKSLPKLDAVFVPGGDPGELEPDALFDWMGKEAKVMRKYHPKAKIWVSPQVFKPSKSWYDRFFKRVNEKPDWLGGVVYGPWIKMPLRDVRAATDPSLPIRLYPDITHSYSCQFPVPEWDLAFVMTLGRECINPRPMDEKHIHNLYAPLAHGSISYSEGTNDDVNKFIWTDQDWNPNTPVIETLRDYARFFINSKQADNLAQGLLALEENFRGSLLSNGQVQRTLQQWQDMETAADKQTLSNPRFQSGLIRAYFDAYIQRRLLYETGLEQQARNILEVSKQKGALSAIKEAKEILLLAKEKPNAQSLRERCMALADSLFRSFGAQLTIGKHHGMGGRGNFIDNIDIPLNDALWLFDQMNSIEKIDSEEKRLEAIYAMLHRADSGPGGFYDDFGSPSSWKRIIRQKTWSEDPGGLESPRVSFGVGLQGVDWVDEIVAKGFEGQTTPLAWMNQINTLYDSPLEMEYNSLDPEGEYNIQIAYTGRFRSSIKLMIDGTEIHGYTRMGARPIFNFPIPKSLTADGKINLLFTCEKKDNGEGERGTQVAEIWIMKK